MRRGGGKKWHGRGRGKHGRGEDEEIAPKDEEEARFQEARPQAGGKKGKKNHGQGKEKQSQNTQKQGHSKGSQAGGGKHGQDKEKQGPGTHAKGDPVHEAKVKAASKLRKALDRQKTFADVPRFVLDMLEKDLRRNIQLVVAKRDVRFGFVGSTECEKVQVTPPHHSVEDDVADEDDEANIGPDEITYHILVFKSKKGVLEVLIREYDGYVIAIRRQPKDKNQNHGWFVYSDVDLPVHLFGEKNWKMKYNSGYKYQEDVEMGKGALDKMVEVLVAFDERTRLWESDDREQMLQTLNVFAGEAQRLSALLRFFLVNIDSDPWVCLGSLSFWTNHWTNLGDATIRVKLAHLAKILLKKEPAELEVAKHMEKANGSLKAFKHIPLTQDQFKAKTTVKLEVMIPSFLNDLRIYSGFVAGNIFVDGKIVKGHVSGTDEARKELSLPILISYIMLMKYEKSLVPELILRQEEYALFLKGKNTKERKMKMRRKEAGVTRAG